MDKAFEVKSYKISISLKMRHELMSFHRVVLICIQSFEKLSGVETCVVGENLFLKVKVNMLSKFVCNEAH